MIAARAAPLAREECMRIVWRTCATIAAALAFSTAAPADEADIFAHYDAYESAFEAGRYDVADTEAEAAWRAAEAEWGGVEDTAVLAFNLLRVRLMADRRAESIEAARWLAQLVERGAAGASVRPEEAVLFRRLAEFNGENPSRSDLRELKEALEAYRPTDFATRRIDWLGWSYVANGYSLREQWRDAAGAADRAGGLIWRTRPRRSRCAPPWRSTGPGRPTRAISPRWASSRRSGAWRPIRRCPPMRRSTRR
jgi:hypothetical protein